MTTIISPQQLNLFDTIQPVTTPSCSIFSRGNVTNKLTSQKSEGDFISKTQFTFVDLFAGIGGFRIPLQELGGVCLGFSEIDKKAIKVYHQNFIQSGNSTELFLGDIKQIDNLPFNGIDIIVGGVPCQPWSIAGKPKGLGDPRGQLWNDVFRLVEQSQPKAFIFENVKGLSEPRNRSSLEYIFENLSRSGYAVKYQILNSYDFGLPQDRDRIFIVGIRSDLPSCSDFKFPQPLNYQPKLYDLITDLQPIEVVKKKFTSAALFNGKAPASRGRFQKSDELNDFFLFTDIRDSHTTIHSWDIIETTDREKLICKTILKNRRKKIYGPKDGNPLALTVLQRIIPNLDRSELDKLVLKKFIHPIEERGYEFVNSKISAGINGISKIFLPHADAIATLTATGTKDFIATRSIECQEPQLYKQNFIKEIYLTKSFKALSAQDYLRLQGFPEWFQIADSELSAKHQFGNAVSVPVVYHLMKSLLKTISYSLPTRRI